MNDFYQVDDSERDLSALSFRDTEKTSVYFENVSIQEAVNTINKNVRELAVVLVPSESMQDIEVSGLYEGTLSEIVNDLASAYNLKFDIVGNKYYIGAEYVAIENTIVYCTVESALDADTIKQVQVPFQEVFISSFGSKILISGRLRQVKILTEMLTAFDETPRSYICNLVLVKCKRSALSDFTAKVTASSLDLISKGYNLYDVFNAQLDFSASKTSSDQYLEQVVYCTDGQSSNLKIGTEIQKEKKSISDYGTASVAGYERFTDGIDFQITPKRSIENYVNVELKFSSSKFSNIDELTKDQVDIEYNPSRYNSLRFVTSKPKQLFGIL